ncbi:hypothetical protein ccbrp13_04320 [Ktedonobacteria bacterium brp13]|nr:hypothetical protein ccbrp13_04320 [Ktedonobacteria bacterium brp13]
MFIGEPDKFRGNSRPVIVDSDENENCEVAHREKERDREPESLSVQIREEPGEVKSGYNYKKSTYQAQFRVVDFCALIF